MDNTLSLNCGGVSIQGIKATIFGQLKASLTSGLCESLSLGNGDIEIAANNLFATTFDKANMTMAMAFGIAESASNLASFIASAVDSANARTYEEIVSGGKIDTKLAYHRMCNEVSSWLTYGSSVTGLMTTAAMVWVMFGGSTVGRYVPQKPLNDKLKTCLTVSSLVLPVWSLLVSLVNYFLGSHSSRRWFMDIGNVICSLFCEIVQII